MDYKANTEIVGEAKYTSSFGQNTGIQQHVNRMLCDGLPGIIK